MARQGAGRLELGNMAVFTGGCNIEANVQENYFSLARTMLMKIYIFAKVHREERKLNRGCWLFFIVRYIFEKFLFIK